MIVGRGKLTCTGRDVEDRELELWFNKESCTWELQSDSLVSPEKLLPEEMQRFISFMAEVKNFSGSNTELAEQLNAYAGLTMTPKSLKQMMNRWKLQLQEQGVMFRNRRSNSLRLVEVLFSSAGDTSDARLSPEDLKQKHQMLMAMASKAQATVQITDNNGKTLIGSQEIQIEMLTRILNKLDTLTTSDELTDYMERQIQILQDHAEETVQIMEEYIIQISLENKPEVDPVVTALEAVQAQLAGLQQQQDNLCDYLEKGVYTIDMFTKRNAALSKEIKKLQTSEAELIRKQEAGSQASRAAMEIIPTTRQILNNYDVLTITEKNRLWKLVLKKATVYRNPEGELSVHIYPRLPK